MNECLGLPMNQQTRFMIHVLNNLVVDQILYQNIKEGKQAGAELYQAHEKLGLPKPALLSKKLSSSSLQNKIEVVFQLREKRYLPKY